MFINKSAINPQFFPGMNPMGLGSPWADAYIQPQQNEQYSVMFINIDPQKRKKYSVMFINLKTQ